MIHKTKETLIPLLCIQNHSDIDMLPLIIPNFIAVLINILFPVNSIFITELINSWITLIPYGTFQKYTKYSKKSLKPRQELRLFITHVALCAVNMEMVAWSCPHGMRLNQLEWYILRNSKHSQTEENMKVFYR